MKEFARRFLAPAFAIAGFALLLTSCDILGLLQKDPNKTTTPPTASTDANLASLSIDVGTLSPSFNAATIAYSVNVATDVASVTLTASPRDSGATVAGTGAKALGAAGTTTDAPVVVTAADGTTKKTYTVSIHRAAVAASSEAHLSALSVGGFTLSPVFATGTFTYDLGTSTNLLANVTVSATATDSKATVTGTGSWSLNVGSNTRTVSVVAEDGTTTLNYSLTITREGSNQLATLTLTPSPLGFSFDPSASSTYDLNVANGTGSITLAATPQDSSATMKLSLDGGISSTTYDGSATSISLPEGLTHIEVQVTGQYGIYAHVYRLNITRAAAGASNDATLSNVVLTEARSGTAVDISPTFASGTTAYTATVSSAVDSINYTATPTDSGAVGDFSGKFALTTGTHNHTITVTAADGVTQQVYTFTITRLSPPTLTITSPANGSTVNVKTLTVNGTYTDADSQIASIKVSFANPMVTTPATFANGSYSADLTIPDTETNGSKEVIVQAFDANNNILVISSTTVNYTAGVQGYSVPVTFSFSGTAVSGYLTAYLRDSSNNIVGMVTGILVSASDFPKTITLQGIPDGTWSAAAVLTDGPDPFASTPLAQGGSGSNTVTVAGADITSPLPVGMIPL